jgi:hypothetical protein
MDSWVPLNCRCGYFSTRRRRITMRIPNKGSFDGGLKAGYAKLGNSGCTGTAFFASFTFLFDP